MKLLYNPTSGRSRRGKDAAESIRRRLEAAGDLQVLAPDGSIEQAARQALADGVTRVVACGGDGSVNGVASALVSTEAAMGVVPLGTRNHFARDAGVPLDVDEALETLHRGETHRVDVATVNGRFFLNNSSIGLYPALVRHRESVASPDRPSLLRSALASLRRSYWRHRELAVHIDTDKRRLSASASLVFIGNNVYDSDGLRSRSRLDQGLLSLVTTQHPGLLQLLWLALRSLILRREPNVLTLLETSGQLTVRAPAERLAVAYDGEVCELPTPFRYAVLPKALNLLVPSTRGRKNASESSGL